MVKLFLHHKAFLSFETDKSVGTACIGACKGSLFVKDCLDYYKDKHFILPNGNLNTLPNPHIFGLVLKNKGIIY